jgi:hypothetical protein
MFIQHQRERIVPTNNRTYKPNSRKRQPGPVSKFLDASEALGVCPQTLWGITRLSKKHEAMRARRKRAHWPSSPTVWALNSMSHRSTRRSTSTPSPNPHPRRDVASAMATFSGARNGSGPPESCAAAAYRGETLAAAGRAQSSRELLGRVRPTPSCLGCAAIAHVRCDPW